MSEGPMSLEDAVREAEAVASHYDEMAWVVPFAPFLWTVMRSEGHDSIPAGAVCVFPPDATAREIVQIVDLWAPTEDL